MISKTLKVIKVVDVFTVATSVPYQTLRTRILIAFPFNFGIRQTFEREAQDSLSEYGVRRGIAVSQFS